MELMSSAVGVKTLSAEATGDRVVFSTGVVLADVGAVLPRLKVGWFCTTTGSVTGFPLKIKPAPEEVVGKKTVICGVLGLVNMELSKELACGAERLYAEGIGSLESRDQGGGFEDRALSAQLF